MTRGSTVSTSATESVSAASAPAPRAVSARSAKAASKAASAPAPRASAKAPAPKASAKAPAPKATASKNWNWADLVDKELGISVGPATASKSAAARGSKATRATAPKLAAASRAEEPTIKNGKVSNLAIKATTPCAFAQKVVDFVAAEIKKTEKTKTEKTETKFCSTREGAKWSAITLDDHDTMRDTSLRDAVEKHVQGKIQKELLNALKEKGKTTDGWYLKGGVALALRGVTAAKDSTDIDVQITDPKITMTKFAESFREAIHRELQKLENSEFTFVTKKKDTKTYTMKFVHGVQDSCKVTNKEKNLTMKVDIIEMDSVMKGIVVGRCAEHLNEYNLDFANWDGGNGKVKWPVTRYWTFINNDSLHIGILQLKATVALLPKDPKENKEKVRHVTLGLMDLVYPPKTEEGYRGVQLATVLNDVGGIPVPKEDYLIHELGKVMDRNSGVSPEKRSRAFKRAGEILKNLPKTDDNRYFELGKLGSAQLGGKPSGKPGSKSSGKSSGKLSGKPTGKSSGKPGSKSSGKPGSKSTGKSSGTPKTRRPVVTPR